MLIGIAGALLATLSAAKWVYTRRPKRRFIMSLVGAIILLAIYRLFKGKSATA